MVVQTFVRGALARRSYAVLLVEHREAAKLENQILALQRKLDEERKARLKMEEVRTPTPLPPEFFLHLCSMVCLIFFYSPSSEKTIKIGCVSFIKKEIKPLDGLVGEIVEVGRRMIYGVSAARVGF